MPAEQYTINTRLHGWLIDTMAAVAKSEGISRTAWLREAVAEWIEKRDTAPFKLAELLTTTRLKAFFPCRFDQQMLEIITDICNEKQISRVAFIVDAILEKLGLQPK